MSAEAAPPSVTPAAAAPTPRLTRRFTPPSGWGPIFIELAIVVLGVMIALAAGQAVESWVWHKKASDGEAAIRRDIDTLVPVLAEQVAVQPCVDAQLDGLAQAVLRSGDVLAAVRDLSGGEGRPSTIFRPTRPLLFGAWESLVADGTATRLAADRRGLYSALAAELALLRSLNDEADRVDGRLSVLAYPMEVDPGVRKDLLVEIAEQRNRLGLAALIALQSLDGLRSAGLMPDDKVIDGEMEGVASQWPPTCRALGKPPLDFRGLLKPR